MLSLISSDVNYTTYNFNESSQHADTITATTLTNRRYGRRSRHHGSVASVMGRREIATLQKVECSTSESTALGARALLLRPHLWMKRISF